MCYNKIYRYLFSDFEVRRSINIEIYIFRIVDNLVLNIYLSFVLFGYYFYVIMARGFILCD